jgi:prepilin-type N-terminal cleavage/methylation domain-containing protein
MHKIVFKKGFTLIELMTVIIIVGILATISVVHLTGSSEMTLDKEAKANLKLISAAEKIYRMEAGGYANASNELTINSVLRLMLPANVSSKNWNYTVTVAGTNNSTFVANATRTRGSRIRSFTINETEEEPHS